MRSFIIFLVFTFSALFASCSHVDPIKSRFPASVVEDNINGEIRIDAKEFSQLDQENYSFYDFIKTAQDHHYKKITIEPKLSDFQTVSSGEKGYVSGDFVVLIGVSLSDKDESIRMNSYKLLYDAVNRMSRLQFRVVINTMASMSDLRNTLKSDRPTIVVWSSHGDPNYFYDFNNAQVPHNVFEKMSPSVYQFLLVSCNGFSALQDGYSKYLAKSTYYSGWTRLVTALDMQQILSTSSNWDPYRNYPGKLVVSGLTCAKNENNYEIKNIKTGAIIPGTSYSKFENCAYLLANADENYLCSYNHQAKKWDIYNHKQQTAQPGVRYEYSSDCYARITNAIGGRVCRFIESDKAYRFVDKTNTLSKEKFETLFRCSDYIQKNFEL